MSKQKKRTFDLICELLIYLIILFFFSTIPVSVALFLSSWFYPAQRYELQITSGLIFGPFSLLSMILSFMLVYNEKAHLEKLKRKKKKFGTFSVMTYNVNFEICNSTGHILDLNSRTKKMIEYLNNSICDIIFFQETHEGFEALFNEYLKENYPYQYYQRDNNWVAGGMAIISKFELKVKSIKYAHEKSYFTGMLCEYNDVEFLNVHLTPPLRLGKNAHFAMENFKLVYVEAPKSHRKEIEFFLDFFTKEKRIILGDFNDSGLSKWMKKRKFKDSLVESDEKITWYWPLKLGLSLFSSYDHIYYSNHFFCEYCKVETDLKNVSDHLPVVSKLNYLHQ